MGEVEPHDPVVGIEEAGVDGKVGGGAGVGLHVHPPLRRVKLVHLGTESQLVPHKLCTCYECTYCRRIHNEVNLF